jgi:hypothetical protein
MVGVDTIDVMNAIAAPTPIGGMVDVAQLLMGWGVAKVRPTPKVRSTRDTLDPQGTLSTVRELIASMKSLREGSGNLEITITSIDDGDGPFPLHEGNAEGPRGVDEVLEVVRNFKNMLGSHSKILRTIERETERLDPVLARTFQDELVATREVTSTVEKLLISFGGGTDEDVPAIMSLIPTAEDLGLV